MKARFAQSLMKSFMVACTLVIAVLLHAGLADAQSSSRFTDGVWQDADKSELVQSAAITPGGAPGGTQPKHYRLLRANLAALDAILAQAPREGVVNAASASAALTLPLPDGSDQRFRCRNMKCSRRTWRQRTPNSKPTMAADWMTPRALFTSAGRQPALRV